MITLPRPPTPWRFFFFLKCWRLRSNCGFLLALFLFIGGCSSSKRHDNGTVEDAAASNPHHQMARDDQPPGTGATLFDRTESGSSEPPNHQSILEDARTALGAGEYESAGEKVRTYLLAHPGDVMGLFLAAQIEAACERYLAAVALLDEIPRDHPQAGLAALGQSADWMLAAHQWDESDAGTTYC